MPPGYPGEENLWAVAFWLTVEEKTWDFRLLSVRLRFVGNINAKVSWSVVP